MKEVKSWTKKYSMEVFKESTDPRIRLMAYGVHHALSGRGKATNYDDLALIMDSIIKFDVICHSIKMEVFVDNNTTVSSLIDQIVWMKGCKDYDYFNDFSLLGEIKNGGFVLIGRKNNLLQFLSASTAFHMFYLKKSFSRVTMDELEFPGETKTSFYLSTAPYLANCQHSLADSIVIQLCLFQILADERKGHIFTNRTALAEIVSDFIPKKVCSSFPPRFKFPVLGLRNKDAG